MVKDQKEELLLAEREAGEARRRLANILESITDGFYALDREWRFTYLNRKGEEIIRHLHASKEPLIGKSIWEEFPFTVGSNVEHNYRRALAEQVTVIFETFLESFNQWFEVRAYPSSEGLYVYFHDITQRKKAEETQMRLAAVVESSDDAIISMDLNTVITTWNKGAERTFGFSAEEAIGKSISILIPPDYENEEPMILQRLLCGERVDHYETIRMRKDGAMLNVSLTVSPVFNANGKIIGASKISRDVTDAKRSHQVQQRLSAVVESSDDAIISMGLDTIITTWNQGAERMFGYSAKEAIGKSVTMLIPANAENEEPMILSRIVKGERVDHYETIRAHKDGVLLNVSLTVSPIFGSKGEIVGVSKISRNITDRKRAEEALLAAQAELRQHASKLEEQVNERTARLRETIQELEAFSYSVSHDMRSPLRAMQGYAETLLEDYASKLDPTAVDYLTRIRRAASRMDLLIQDVLAYSRVAKSEIHLQPVNLENVFADVISHYPVLQPDRAEIQIQSPLPAVLGHEAYLTQIVSNLLTNAVKFTAPGVRPKVEVYSEKEGEMARLNFKDNGIGIAEEHRKRVFQMFGRVYSDKKYEGTGIGLAIAKKAAERMGGSIGVESEPGRGSKFFVLLKRAE